jgi:CheY-like chemotaxis protein/EAL domain-containing protein (putative c-di-GMP-specific phosphodiesterase class I)
MNAIVEATLAKTLVLQYWPQADVKTGALAGFDLCGLAIDESHAPVDPVTFLRIIRHDPNRARLAGNLLEHVCTDLAALAAAGAPNLPITVRLSYEILADPQFPDRVIEILLSRALSVEALRIGVTASEATHNDMQRILGELKRRGLALVLLDIRPHDVQLELFDGGTFQATQIAMGPVRADIETSPRREFALLAAITGAAHAVNMQVIAVQVEEDEYVDIIRSSQCDVAQGGLCGPKVLSNALTSYLLQAPGGMHQSTEPANTARNLLLVDDEANILSALKRVLRRDGYTIHTAGSGKEGFDILASHPIDVIVSDQRMPGLTGVEFLRQAKQLYPETTRIVLSGYSELQSVVAAINEGAVYKFLMKPWDDVQLREHIADAFRRQEMEDENRRLQAKLKHLNGELSATNSLLKEVLSQQAQRISIDETILNIAREAIEHVPVPVLALDNDYVVAYMNQAALAIHPDGPALLGTNAEAMLPALIAALRAPDGEDFTDVPLNGRHYRLVAHRMGGTSMSRGWIVTLLPTLLTTLND